MLGALCCPQCVDVQPRVHELAACLPGPCSTDRLLELVMSSNESNYSRYRSEIKQALRSNRLIYGLVGWWRYLIFQIQVAFQSVIHVTKRADIDRAFMPPPRLRYRVHRSLDERSFRDAGEIAAGMLYKQIITHGEYKAVKILDFACGCGRVLVPLKRLLPECDFFGSDIDAVAIAWCRKHLAHKGVFEVNNSMPPLVYADGCFDILYSVSLFTHLNEDMQFEWLREIQRVVKVGGICIATVHGRPTHVHCTSGEKEQLHKYGFVFRKDRVGITKLDGLPDFYQTTFHTKYYIESRWGMYFEILDYIEGGLGDHQDVVVMKRVQ